MTTQQPTISPIPREDVLSVHGSTAVAFSFAIRHLKPEPAQQALMVVTPENGITAQAPVLVSDRGTEGW